MDGTSILVGIGVGGVVGAVAAWFMASFAARSATAAERAAAEAARAEHGALSDERDALRLRLEGAQLRLEGAQQGESAAKATLLAAQDELRRARELADAERQRAEQESALRAKTQQELRATEERSLERDASSQRLLAERERSLAELRATVEQSRTALADAFKATGGDVLKATAEELLKQARTQFEGQHKLSAQELEARQKAIDETLRPLREQLAKNEALVKELGEKREGDAKTLDARLKEIAELQLRASSAAQTLSSAMRDNRQRGRWGEIGLRNVLEMSGMGMHVDFTEQGSLESEDGARLRPDVVVRLPGERMIPIDAKVPMNAYFDSIDPEVAEVERVRRRDAHAAAVRSHVRTLTSREYAKALGGEVEITVMFVPVESALVAALEADGELYRDALDARVIIVTPSTLLALLRTCALQWQQAKLNENARQIGENAKELLKRLQKFAGDVGAIGRSLDSATKAYNEAVGSFNRRLLPAARDTADLAGELGAGLEDLDAQSRAVREDLSQPKSLE